MSLEIFGVPIGASGEWSVTYSVNGRDRLVHKIRDRNVRNSADAIEAARRELDHKAGGFQTRVPAQPDPF
jgi:hypothetical protein